MGVVCRDKDKEGETGQCGSVMWRMDWVLVGIQLLTSHRHCISPSVKVTKALDLRSQYVSLKQIYTIMN
jgi:hypothetical protein